MTNYLNTIKALEATVKRFQKEHGEVFQILRALKIKSKTLPAGVRRLVKRMKNARNLLK